MSQQQLIGEDKGGLGAEPLSSDSHPDSINTLTVAAMQQQELESWEGESRAKVTQQPESSQSVLRAKAKQVANATSMQQKTRMHHKHSLQESNENMRESKQYMEKVMYKVPLDKLYKVIASCQYNEKGLFCPVLVKIIDPEVRRLNDGKEYLLQVWTRKGVMIFEMPLVERVTNWNISDNKFIFQKTKDSTDIYVVRLCDDATHEQNTEHKMVTNTTPVVFKFTNAAFAARYADSLQEELLSAKKAPNRDEQHVSPTDGDNILQNVTEYDVDNSKDILLQEKSFGPSNSKKVTPFKIPKDDQNDDIAVVERRMPSGNIENISVSQKIDPALTALQFNKEHNIGPKEQSRLEKKIRRKQKEMRKSITEMAEGRFQIIERAPAKMIDFLQGNIVIAQYDKLVYCDVASKMQQISGGSTSFVDFSVDINDIQTIKIKEGEYTIELLQEIGMGMTAIVLQEKETFQLRFFRAEFNEEIASAKKNIKLVQLGTVVAKSDYLTHSPLLKFRSVAKSEIDPKTGKNLRYQVAIAVRQNGRIEVYSDFMLVDEYYHHDHQCVDVETNFNAFSLKMVKKCSTFKATDFDWKRPLDKNESDQWNKEQKEKKIDLSELIRVNEGEDWKSDYYTSKMRDIKHFQGKSEVPKGETHENLVEVRQIPHFWRNRISFNTSVVKASQQGASGWDRILHKRIADFFRLYTQVLNYQVHMLVSHGNLISVYDMTLQTWVCTLSLDSYIRSMFIKKRDKHERDQILAKAKAKGNQYISIDQQYELVCMNEHRYIKTVQIERNGALGNVRTFDAQEHSDIEGKRLISFQDDDNFGNGLLFMTDNNETAKFYKIEQDCKLYTYPIDEKPNSQYFLYVFKQGKPHKLLDSTKPYNGSSNSCLAYDSFFSVLRANKNIFDVEQAEKIPEFRKEFGKKDQVNVVVCTSDSNNRSLRLVLIKERKEGSKQIKTMKFLEALTQDIQVVKTSDDEPPIHSFFITEPEYGEDNDNYVQISEKMITVYSKTMQKIKQRVEGLKIRSCIDVNQSYIYTISDEIKNAFQIFKGEEEGEFQPNFKQSSSGLFVYDISKLFSGKVEKYKLAQAIGGVCNFIDNSKFSDRFSFIQDYNTIAVIPFPHLNLINCIGMDLKREYVIWREKNGFFTALDRRGDLLTWSLTNGKLLYKESQENEDGDEAHIIPYQVFQSGSKGTKDNDITYTKNFYDMEDCSISLLKSSKPFAKKFKAVHQSKNDQPSVKQEALSLIHEMSDQGSIINNKSAKEAENLLNNEIQRLFTMKKDDIQNNQFMNNLAGIRSEANFTGYEEDKFVYQFKKNLTVNQQKVNEKGTANHDQQTKKVSPTDFVSIPRATIAVRNSGQESQKYHFKVMKLRVLEDFAEQEKDKDGKLVYKKHNDQHANKCELLFHFFFDMIHQPKQNQNDKLEEFDWDVTSDLQQRLYLSQDKTKMMEVINNFIAKVYTRVYITRDATGQATACQEGESQEVEWRNPYIIKRYPKSFFDKCSVPYLFSPNFTYMLDFDYNMKQFVIRKTKKGNVHLRIPADLIKTSWGKMEFKEAILMIASRFKWISETELNFVSVENFDTIFAMRETNFGNDKARVEDRRLEQISSVKIDNLYENSYQRDSPHLLVQPNILESRDVLERLIRTNQDYKRYISHALNRKEKGSKLLTMINKIDYLQAFGSIKSKFDVETSFTWLDWRILELEIHDEVFNLQDVETEQKIQLAFNIMPMGRGFLHQLALGGQKNNKAELNDDHVKMMDTTEKMFKTASELIDLQLTGVDPKLYPEGTSFQIPVLPDMYGGTALDMSLAVIVHREADEIVFYPAHGTAKESFESTNEMMADVIFKHIKDYGFMHSSQLINESVIKALELALPSIGDYMESRLIKVDIDSNTQNPIKNSLWNGRQYFADSIGDYGMITARIQETDSEITEQMFKKKEEGVSQKTMIMRYVDIPRLHQTNDEGRDFINALAANPNIELFDLESIQLMINAQQKHWLKLDFAFFFLPRLIQLIIFTYWSNIILPNLGAQSQDFDKQNRDASIVMNVLSFYQLLMEIPRFMEDYLAYFLRINSLINLAVIVLIFINTVDQNLESELFWSIQTWTALLIWFRLLIKMRIIGQFSWLIRMIIACIKDMTVFMIVLLVGVFAFADAFSSINKVLELNGSIQIEEIPEDASIYLKYYQVYIVSWQNSYLFALGEFGDNLEFYRESDWLVFFIATIFNIILLLNLLIAIISDTYARVAEKAIANSYIEKVFQIQEMQVSIFGQFKIFGREKDIYGKEIGSDCNQLILIANVQPTDEPEAEMGEKIESLCEELASVKKLSQDNNEMLTRLMEKLCPTSDDEQDAKKE